VKDDTKIRESFFLRLSIPQIGMSGNLQKIDNQLVTIKINVILNYFFQVLFKESNIGAIYYQVPVAHIISVIKLCNPLTAYAQPLLGCLWLPEKLFL